MSFNAKYIPYRQTGSFSKLATDYLDDNPALREFYAFPPDLDGIKKAIASRKHISTNRELLVTQLREQYKLLSGNEKLTANIESLLDPGTFTVCTAHQPNIFTGHLYFIYKIIHAIKLADELKQQLPGNHFVPVFYMGSEDADLEELGEVIIHGKKYTWQTQQKGAVGRMKIDKTFIDIIQGIEGQLLVERFGADLLGLVKEAYTLGKTIEQATFEFVNRLFGIYGLVVLLPDNAALKNEFNPITEKELGEKFSHELVKETIASFPAQYKVQAAGREINFFYLKDDIRERIEIYKDGFAVANTSLVFSKEEMFREIKDHPGRFSPNVILRPLFQELVLPNIAFIGGGGELSYWLELKKVFDAVNIPFPVLVLRNSFLLINKKIAARIGKLHLDHTDLFKDERLLVEALVKKESSLPLQLSEETMQLQEWYSKVKIIAGNVDASLAQHVASLQTQALKRVKALEKKMLRAEKKKFDAQQRQLRHIKETLFPSGVLQERVDNLLPYYAVWGASFIEMLYANSTGLQQEFCIVEESTAE